jgi:hypothetical protein
MAQPWYLFSSLYWLKINVKTSFTFHPYNYRKNVVKVMESTDDRQGDDIPTDSAALPCRRSHLAHQNFKMHFPSSSAFGSRQSETRWV